MRMAEKRRIESKNGKDEGSERIEGAQNVKTICAERDAGRYGTGAGCVRKSIATFVLAFLHPYKHVMGVSF